MVSRIGKSVFVASLIMILAASLATAQTKNKDKAPPKGDQPQLPPGVSAEDMQAMMVAATPGKEHAMLASRAGSWQGTSTMWMGPDAPPIKSACSCTITPIFDNRFVKIEVKGDMGGMAFNGLGYSGFDNVSKKYVSTWLDNMGTGMMTGTGEASDNGKKLTWTYTMNCPIQKKPITMRQIENYPDANTMVLEAFGPDPKTGKEFKNMRIEFTKKATRGAAGR